MSRKLASWQQKVYDYLLRLSPGYASPTQIARDVYGGAATSSWASPKCLSLLKKGYVKRNKRGWYCATPEAHGG